MSSGSQIVIDKEVFTSIAATMKQLSEQLSQLLQQTSPQVERNTSNDSLVFDFEQSKDINKLRTFIYTHNKNGSFFTIETHHYKYEFAHNLYVKDDCLNYVAYNGGSIQSSPFNILRNIKAFPLQKPATFTQFDLESILGKDSFYTIKFQLRTDTFILNDCHNVKIIEDRATPYLHFICHKDIFTIPISYITCFIPHNLAWYQRICNTVTTTPKALFSITYSYGWYQQPPYTNANWCFNIKCHPEFLECISLEGAGIKINKNHIVDIGVASVYELETKYTHSDITNIVNDHSDIQGISFDIEIFDGGIIHDLRTTYKDCTNVEVIQEEPCDYLSIMCEGLPFKLPIHMITSFTPNYKDEEMKEVDSKPLFLQAPFTVKEFSHFIDAHKYGTFDLKTKTAFNTEVYIHTYLNVTDLGICYSKSNLCLEDIELWHTREDGTRILMVCDIIDRIEVHAKKGYETPEYKQIVSECTTEQFIEQVKKFLTTSVAGGQHACKFIYYLLSYGFLHQLHKHNKSSRLGNPIKILLTDCFDTICKYIVEHPKLSDALKTNSCVSVFMNELFQYWDIHWMLENMLLWSCNPATVFFVEEIARIDIDKTERMSRDNKFLVKQIAAGKYPPSLVIEVAITNRTVATLTKLQSVIKADIFATPESTERWIKHTYQTKKDSDSSVREWFASQGHPIYPFNEIIQQQNVEHLHLYWKACDGGYPSKEGIASIAYNVCAKSNLYSQALWIYNWSERYKIQNVSLGWAVTHKHIEFIHNIIDVQQLLNDERWILDNVKSTSNELAPMDYNPKEQIDPENWRKYWLQAYISASSRCMFETVFSAEDFKEGKYAMKYLDEVLCTDLRSLLSSQCSYEYTFMKHKAFYLNRAFSFTSSSGQHQQHFKQLFALMLDDKLYYNNQRFDGIVKSLYENISYNQILKIVYPYLNNVFEHYFVNRKG